MAAFKVVSIVDGNTIKVDPAWSWDRFTGNIVKLNSTPFGFFNTDTNPILKSRLINLLQNQMVELKNPSQGNGAGELYCQVFLNGIDVLKYFPELTLSSS